MTNLHVLASAAMAGSLAAGTVLADTYRIVRLIGKGGMGEVYEAAHARLAGRYAVKVLLAEMLSREEVFQRFRREAEVTSALRHPNIIQVLDFNLTPEGHPYLVMEYLDGVELASEIHRVGAMPVPRVLGIVGQIASALTASHALGVVHRDLKPQNIFLLRLPREEREVVKVVDFGISKVREATTQLTQDSSVMGTPQYMAPEQALGKVAFIDERTDEFALASITYELLTGMPAFQADSAPAILYQVVHEEPRPLRDLAALVSPALAAVVTKAMSKSQRDRYPTVLDFQRDLERAANPTGIPVTVKLDGPEVPRPPTELEVSPPTTLGLATGTMEGGGQQGVASRRRWLWAVLGGVLAFAAVALAVFRWTSPDPDKTATVSHDAAVVKADAAQPRQAIVEVEDAPPGLQVTVDGVPSTVPVLLPAGPETHLLRFVAPDYEATEIRVDGRHERRLVVLTKSVRPDAKPAREKRTHKVGGEHAPEKWIDTGTATKATIWR